MTTIKTPKAVPETVIIARVTKALGPLSPAAKHRVMNFVWASINEEIETERVAKLATQRVAEHAGNGALVGYPARN